MLPGILTASELERAFQRERARVDRNAQCFSIVVFHLRPQGDDDARHLAAILRERIREYDDVGVVDKQRLATLLPEADGEDAWQFADQALLQISEAGLAVNCEVFTYPHPESAYAPDGPAIEDERGTEGVARPSPGPNPGPNPSDDGASSSPLDLTQRAEHTASPLGSERAPRIGRLGNELSVAGRNLPAGGRIPTGRRLPLGASLADAMMGARGPASPPSTASEPDPMRATGTDSGASPLLAVHDPDVDERPGAEPLAPVPFESRPRRAVTPRKVGDLATLFEEPLPLYRRAIDVAVAGSALIALTPIFVVTALAVKLTSPGPLIFGQWRAGRGGRPFRFYKFRSMYRDAEAQQNGLRLVNEKDGPIFKIKNDPRITPVGRVIRKLSIDELPQLVNVLRGDMTLVGPRPPVMDEVEAYEPWQRQRLEVTGGITCIWQVSGRSEVTFKEWMRMDVRYRKKRSLGLDLRLLWKTFGAVFSGKGAY